MKKADRVRDTRARAVKPNRADKKVLEFLKKTAMRMDVPEDHRKEAFELSVYLVAAARRGARSKLSVAQQWTAIVLDVRSAAEAIGISERQVQNIKKDFFGRSPTSALANRLNAFRSPGNTA